MAKTSLTVRVFEGSVSGTLERLNVHNRREFVLYPPIAGYRVKCVFPEELFGAVREAIKGNVTVSGKMYFHRERPFPDLLQVEEMVLHEPDERLPSLASLKGLAPNCSGGMESVQYVRGIRDEQ